MRRGEGENILFLCVGNRTRSIFAEMFFPKLLREISRWEGYLLLEDFHGYPLDSGLWDYIEEHLPYVSAMLSEMEKLLVRAVPYILKQLGENQNVFDPTDRSGRRS